MVPVKFVVCIPDGCADEPLDALDGKTPMQVAEMPVLRALAARGTVGRAAVIPEGMPPGSDVGNLSILGYDPAEFHTGRAPIEAAALGIELAPDEIAFRCNLVTVVDGTMVDFAGGHPSNELAAEAIAALGAALGTDKIRFYPGVQYRHIVVTPRSLLGVEAVPPHDLTGQAAVDPTGEGADAIIELQQASRAVLAGVDGLAANQIWLWGQGPQPTLESFEDRFGVRAGMVTAVDLVRGLGALAGIERTEVEGANGWFDTNYEGKRDAAIEGLRSGLDLFVVHVEATDEAGHAGDVAEKVGALENWDRRILAGLVEYLDGQGPWRLLMLPDHATPLALRTHTTDPVPYLLVDSATDGAGGSFDEAGVADQPIVAGHDLMGLLLSSTG